MITEFYIRSDLFLYLCRQHQIPESHITDKADLRQDLGLDSISLLQLILYFEVRYNIRINPALFVGKLQFGQICSNIKTIITEQHGI